MDRRLKNTCNTYEEIAKTFGTLDKLEYCNETNRRLEVQGSEAAYSKGKNSSPIRNGALSSVFGGHLQRGGDGSNLPDFFYYENPEDGKNYIASKKAFEAIEIEKEKRGIDLRKSENKIFQQKRLKIKKEYEKLKEKSSCEIEEKSFQGFEPLGKVWTGPSGLFASNSSTKERDKIMAEEGFEALTKWILEKYEKNDYYMYVETPDDGIFSDKRIILVETELVIKHLIRDPENIKEHLVYINLKALLEELEQIKNQQDNKAA